MDKQKQRNWLQFA